AEGGPIALAAAFPRMYDDEHTYYITDSSLTELADTLARTSPPLLTATPTEADGRLLQATVELTEAGREVLAGRRDRVACGIDRWLGGVHLQQDNIWRWDDERGRVIKA